MAEVRLDKWLWAVRIFKTRSIAADNCKKGRVQVDGADAKASKLVSQGDIVSVRKPPVTYSYRVKKVTQNRVGAKLVPEMYEDVTPPDQKQILELNRLSGIVGRARGTGRPTKKDRRQLEDFFGY